MKEEKINSWSAQNGVGVGGGGRVEVYKSWAARRRERKMGEKGKLQ